MSVWRVGVRCGGCGDAEPGAGGGCLLDNVDTNHLGAGTWVLGLDCTGVSWRGGTGQTLMSMGASQGVMADGKGSHMNLPGGLGCARGGFLSRHRGG